eukprot:NODE_2879_length_730_cov_30.575624_g2034_i0.p3 GENE.NODE_2879_length_730_cov_30.575624_g2034_i0~~NODE_2879_length_730_cov_30.575624_g2034_i0.p3  ORF type:complete len:67 (+),score=9.48 NODE_2879_length_730_cov_30.575624_g2034_i0:447-647(+)
MSLQCSPLLPHLLIRSGQLPVALHKFKKKKISQKFLIKKFRTNIFFRVLNYGTSNFESGISKFGPG